MVRLKKSFEDVCVKFESALDGYQKDRDVEKFQRIFEGVNNRYESQTIGLLWLEDSNGKQWFEVDGYVNGDLEWSETFHSEEELIEAAEDGFDDHF